MLIVGAGGLVAQMYEDLVASSQAGIKLWSEIETKYVFLKERFDILKTDDEVANYFKHVSDEFVIAIGGVENRKKLKERFTSLGGNMVPYISKRTIISPYARFGKGTLVLSRVEVEADAIIGDNCLLNKTAEIGHGCIIGNNCEITPGVILTGEVMLGNDCSIGVRSVILPKVKIGNNVTIAPGSFVKKDIPDNAVVAGEFATVKFFKK
jgi:sugar O-acyltransferase (sialic acid O-acetyltransferase NeuD family)